MHRSGTSMIARLLNSCGLYLGPEDELIPAKAGDNDEGFWEHAAFVDLNEKILQRLGSFYEIPPRLFSGWEEQAGLAEFAAEARQLIARFQGHPVWGWKDPRNSITFAFWRKLLPDLKLVVCIRNPVEVAASLRTRDGYSERHGLNMWLAYHQALAVFATPAHVVTHYDSYFLDPTAELRRVSQLLGLSCSDEQIEQACSLISRTLKRHQLREQDLMALSVPEAVRELYGGLCQHAGPLAPTQPLGQAGRPAGSVSFRDYNDSVGVAQTEGAVRHLERLDRMLTATRDELAGFDRRIDGIYQQQMQIVQQINTYIQQQSHSVNEPTARLLNQLLDSTTRQGQDLQTLKADVQRIADRSPVGHAGS